MIRVVGSINATGRSDTQSYRLLMYNGIETFVPLKQASQIRHYPTMNEIDYNIGGVIFDELVFDAGFCKNNEVHTHVWQAGESLSPNPERCDCDMVPEDGIYVLKIMSENDDVLYVVHPDENDALKQHVSTKRLKKE